MLATFSGSLALLAGLVLLLLPLLLPELSRPGDSFWGGVILLMGLTLVVSTDRLIGTPMVAILCGMMLIARLATEVAYSRWSQLNPEERQQIWSLERYKTISRYLKIILEYLVETRNDILSRLKQQYKSTLARKKLMKTEELEQ
uniref:Uncharacterized protein n=1 Tax=Paulinella chromatophora TaxID=39717 RepID=B1X4U8_PAUCH|nr:hypothetical protein PCC_0533 [Paulinella chromatophora]ACB42967.1 hypothetical protein PCC_0533 [Paulinella chromatophora]